MALGHFRGDHGASRPYHTPRPEKFQLEDPSFSIDSELVLTLEDPAALTPDLRGSFRPVHRRTG